MKIQSFSNDVFQRMAVLLTVVALAITVPCKARGNEMSGTCGIASDNDGANVTWTLTQTGTITVESAWNYETLEVTATVEVPAYKLTISGTGAMADYDDEDATPWAWANFNYGPGVYESGHSAITALEISGEVSALGKNAFIGLGMVESLTVTSSALTTIVYNDLSSYSLTTLTLPETVTTIDLENNPDCFSNAVNDEKWQAYKSRFTAIGGECGAQGNNLIWTLTAGDEPDANQQYPMILTITGTGAMADYDYDYTNNFRPWHSTPTVLSLPEGLTHIGDYAFVDCNFASVTIPASVETIGTWAFMQCATSAVTFAEGSKLTDLGSYTFSGCGNLSSVVIPAGVKTLETPFRDCSNLKSITFAEGSELEFIGSNTFDGCNSLETIDIPATVKGIEYYTFWRCETLTTVRLNRYEPSDEEYPVTTLMSNTTHDYMQFDLCPALSSIQVPDAVLKAYLDDASWQAAGYCDLLCHDGGFCGVDDTNMGRNVRWRLRPVVKDGTLQTVGGTDKIAYHLDILKNETEGQTNYAMADFDTAPWSSYADQVISVTIGEGVTSIGANAFADCGYKTTYTITHGVTDIGDNAFPAFKTFPYEYQIDGTTVDDPDDVLTRIKNLEEGTLTLSIIKNIAKCEVSVPDQTLDGSSYICYKFWDTPTKTGTVVKDGDEVLTVGKDYEFSSVYFYGTENFCTDEINKVGDRFTVEIRGIGDYAGMTTADFYIISPEANGTWGALAWSIDADGNFSITGTGAMQETTQGNYPWYDKASYIQTITIGDRITSVAANAFAGTSQVNSYGNAYALTLPESLTAIGEDAFAYCTGLSIDLADLAGITNIADNAFSYINSITGTLYDDADNTKALTMMALAGTNHVTLTGHTLYKDGAWNTICLPFDVSMYNSLVDDATATVKELDLYGYYDKNGTRYPQKPEKFDQGPFYQTGYDAESGTLRLYFRDATADQNNILLHAGQPYLIKWTTGGTVSEDLTFYGVKVISSPNNGTSEDGYLNFVGTFSPETFNTADPTKLYLGDGNSLYYPSESMTIGAFRAYFQLNGLSVSDTETTTGAAIRNFVLNLDDEDSHATAIDSVTEDAPRTRTAEGWFRLDGRRLTEKPTQKGVYIHDGKKVFFY